MRSLTITLYIFMLFMLTGCTHEKSTKKSTESAASPQQVIKNENKPADKSISVCQSQLLALSKVNNEMYLEKKRSFDALISGASVYTTVRDDIDTETRETLDALYKFKTQKMCNDIEQSLRQMLINRGENIK